MYNKAFLVFFWWLLCLPLQASESIVIAGSGADLETFRILSRAFTKQHPDSQIKVLPSIGSGGAVRGVATGRINIGLMSRPLKEKEKKYSLTIIHYADTALVFVTNQGSVLTNIDYDSLKAIYRGDDANIKLKPILRPASDSDTLLLEKKLPDIIPALKMAYKRKGIPISLTDQSTIEILQYTKNVISTSTLSLILSENPALKILDLNGIKATTENITSQKYPLIKSLFILHDGKLTPLEQQFIAFVLSSEGKEILSKTGHFF